MTVNFQQKLEILVLAQVSIEDFRPNGYSIFS